jgi:outer membrane scaffolding protein for murein synthesis (MipA/OmpV family)
LLVNQSITGDLLGGLSLFGLGQYSRLVGDFKRAPIVEQRGSGGQWIGALGLAYTW